MNIKYLSITNILIFLISLNQLFSNHSEDDSMYIHRPFKDWDPFELRKNKYIIPDEYNMKKQYQPLLYFNEYILDSLYYDVYYNNQKVFVDSIKFTLIPAYEVGVYKYEYMTQKEYISYAQKYLHTNCIYDVTIDTITKDIFCGTQFKIFYNHKEYIFLYPIFFDYLPLQFKILTSIFHKDPSFGVCRGNIFTYFLTQCMIPRGEHAPISYRR